jgi:hypothetical protein
LEVKLSKVSWQGISALRQLTFLEEFIFTKALQDETKGCCVSSVLQTAAATARCRHRTGGAAHQHFLVATGRIVVGGSAANHHSPHHTLQLRHLALITLIGIPEYVALPEVQVLYLRAPRDEDETPLSPGRFPKLSELNVEGRTAEI